ncbi:MAG TPA: class I SAM-dependent methyltransferase [Planctomycetota bacterium]|nr:class I SAM-dependent methyltransferase [Planctomycetota bacterium]
MPSASASKGARSKRPWYESAFTREYLSQYAHRSDEAARREIPFVVRALKLKRGARVLDLCCGAGRHSRVLAAGGLRVTGLDLSADLLNAANAAGGGVVFVRGDMRRLPFLSESFDGMVNLFTSFGYFNDAENQRVLTDAARVLKPGAPFFMDYLNITHVRRTLVDRSERCVGEMQLCERRWYDPRTRRLNKATRMRCNGAEKLRRESVRAYTRAELTRMLHRAGMKVLKVYGDLSGSRFDARNSPRCVLLARKEPAIGRTTRGGKR